MLDIASLTIALTLVDGPLLQRASSGTRVTREKDVVLNISLTPEVPNGKQNQWAKG
jgi:hypothetical protein